MCVIIMYPKLSRQSTEKFCDNRPNSSPSDAWTLRQLHFCGGKWCDVMSPTMRFSSILEFLQCFAANPFPSNHGEYCGMPFSYENNQPQPNANSQPSQCNRTRQQPGPDNNHTIWLLCGPEISGPDNDHLGLDNDQSLCGPRHIFRTRQQPSPVVVTQS